MKQLNKWQWSTLILSAILVMAFSVFIYRYEPFKSGFEITDQLGGNIFPATILSTATTDANLIVPADSDYIGNPKSCIAIRLKNSYANSKLRIEVAETPFFSQSVSEFILPKAGKEYLVFPDIIWNYQALRDNNQAVPVSISVKAELNKKELPQRLKTISMRSINECPLGYVDDKMKFHDTGEFFAAYVNEEHPQIDKLLREALDTRIVNRFLGYQGNAHQSENVDKQVYALWNVLQKRNFKYSSTTNTSLSSNVVYTQRVRTLDDALESSQINCVDGSVLLASLMKAININPILVRIPGHMFVGYYTDKSHKNMNFLETTMIGDVNLDDFWFETHSLTDAVKEFLQAGGHYLFLDEIHFYSGWMEEVSTLLDANPALKIVFATTSLYSQTEVRNGLRHEAAFYTMHPMSFREFLSYESILDKDPIPLEDILANHHDLVKEINAEMNIVPIYRNYLEHGCYPFYWQDPDMYYFRLQELVRKEICRDLPSVVSISMSNLERAQKYFMMVAESAPLRPKSIDVTRKTNMLRQQSDSLLRFFHDVRLIYYSADQLGTTPAKQKVFMGDTNLLISFFGDKENRQLMCETYFLSQMRSVANVEFMENGDFLIGGKYIFAVGDPLRGYDRLRFVPDAYAAIYGLPKSVFNRMPAWILGFSY